MKNYNQIDELVERAMQPEPELLPLMMPDDTMQVYTAPKQETAPKKEVVTPKADDDEDEFEGKTARQVLISALAEDEDERISLSLPNVLRGDILTSKWIRRQIWWMVMVVLMAFLYVSNRYSAQKQLIENENLKEELKETHYDAMARSSQLMRNSRRSIIVDKLADANSSLTMPERQPAMIE
ncbi:MAG: hypothetical protein J6X27_05775 [Bacteroidaceae bacterium]|nr:hypothetical protein [Bacteroidaceae bacterium]